MSRAVHAVVFDLFGTLVENLEPAGSLDGVDATELFLVRFQGEGTVQPAPPPTA